MWRNVQHHWLHAGWMMLSSPRSQSTNRSPVGAHLRVVSKRSVPRRTGVWISRFTGRVRTPTALPRWFPDQSSPTCRWCLFTATTKCVCVCVLPVAARRGARAAKRSGWWIKPTRRFGTTSVRRPRPTDRSASTSAASSNPAWPWLKSGEAAHVRVVDVCARDVPDLTCALGVSPPQRAAGGLFSEADKGERAERRAGVPHRLLAQPLRCSLHSQRRRPHGPPVRRRLQDRLRHAHQRYTRTHTGKKTPKSYLEYLSYF